MISLQTTSAIRFRPKVVANRRRVECLSNAKKKDSVCPKTNGALRKVDSQKEA